MGISAFVRDKLPLDAICICGDGGGFCDCSTQFAEWIDPDWTDHAFDAWAYLRDYRQYAKPEEWNTEVENWRADCGVTD